jgi:hypothetical protein
VRKHSVRPAKSLLTSLTLTFIAASGIARAEVVTINDPSFENLVLSPPSGGGSYWYSPSINGPGFVSGSSGWNFGTSSVGVSGQGLVGNGSAFGNPNAPDGSMAAFLQHTSAISQLLNFLNVGDTVQFTFNAAGRTGQSGPNQLQVLLDNVVILGPFTPSAGVYSTYTTDAVEITNPNETLTFEGLSAATTGDYTSFIDNVAGTESPEPGTWMMAAAGLAAAGLLHRQKLGRNGSASRSVL